MPTIAEAISQFENKRAALVAANTSIIEKANSEGATLDEAQQQAFDGNEADIVAVDKHLSNLRIQEKHMAQAAKPVDGSTSTAGSETRAYSRIEIKNPHVEKGTAFCRYTLAMVKARGNVMAAIELAKQWNETTPEVERVLKAAVAAGTTMDPAWAGALVDYRNMTSEFAEFVRPATIIGKIPGLRNVPFNIKIPRQTGGSTAQWVGEGRPKPVSALAFDSITLDTAKCAGIVVFSDELARSSDPKIEGVVRDDLRESIVKLIDHDFVDPNKAAGPNDNKSPASITNGVAAIPSAGPALENAQQDINTLIQTLAATGLGFGSAVWITTEKIAGQLATFQNLMGNPAYPGMSQTLTTGGTLIGLPVVASSNVPDGLLILAKASEILLADDGQTLIDASREATLQMDSAPMHPADATTVYASMFQLNMIAVRAERWINWGKRRPNVVAYVSGADYSGIVGP